MILPTIPRIVRAMLTMTCALALPAALSVAGAHPATADDFQQLNGSYTIHIVTRDGGENSSTWNISSTCANEGCKADITGADGWHATAKLIGGHWQMSGTQDGTTVCPDGTSVTKPQDWRYIIDATTLTGSGTHRYGSGCGGPSKLVEFRATLTKA